jgi:hypothetical protein
MRIALLLTLLAGLSACESTSFQAPPVARTACDPALAGTWLSVDDKDPGEVELQIDKGCRLLFVENEKDGRKEGAPTQLQVGSDGDVRYLWVDAAWARERFEMSDAPPAGDIYLLRYAVAGDELTLELPNDKAIAHRIVDGKLRGEISRSETTLRNRLLAPVDPAALREAGFFDDDKGVLRRAGSKQRQ